MKIFKGNGFEDYQNDLKVSGDLISFVDGERLELDGRGTLIVPGFIDGHVHGGYGGDMMDANFEALNKMSRGMVKEGVTSFLATTMTCPEEDLKRAIDAAFEYRDKLEGSRILGVHLEGPFISPLYPGAQKKENIRKPDCAMIERLNENKFIKLVSYAPEEDENFEFTKYLQEHKIVGSFAHTAIMYDLAEKVNDEGIKDLTHFYNAMTPHHHRAAGLVTFALSHTNLNLELIVDGIHIHPEVLEATYLIKGGDSLTLISDATRAKGMPDGKYDLGGQMMDKKGDRILTADGSLAGSILNLHDAMRNMLNWSGASLEEVIRMLTINVARKLGVDDRIGKIEEGYGCDLVVLDEDYNVVQVIVGGMTKYRKE